MEQSSFLAKFLTHENLIKNQLKEQNLKEHGSITGFYIMMTDQSYQNVYMLSAL